MSKPNEIRKQIKVMFTCHACKAIRVPVWVNARGEQEPLLEWMHYVGSEVAIRHTFMSLLCENTQVDLYIPANPLARYIGEFIEGVSNESSK